MQSQPDFLCKQAAGPSAGTPRSAEAQPTSLPRAFSLAYRPDIDGLRALAVLGVVFFHAGVPGFSGGYVGVDVFFVISGYLITRLLVGSDSSSYGSWLKTFYVRRGRRILPALLVTSAVTALAATLLLLPWELPEFGKLLAASSAFLANLAAWAQGEYFNVAANLPIMHFWSLAVEEQFYLAYPLVLLLLTRHLPRHRLLALAALAVISFAVCVWGSYEKARSNFFLAPGRAWELLLGAIIAIGEPHWNPSRTLRELLAVLAGLVLALTFGLYGSELRYPGIATLGPCLATAILIATGGAPTTVVGRFLRQQPLVFTGLVSYSLYLWHLPILTLEKYFIIQDHDTVSLAVSLVVIYAVAIISWRLIEKPVRERSFLKSDRTFLLTAGAINAVLLAGGVALWISNGLPQRFDEADVPRGVTRKIPGCLDVPYGRVASGGLCSYGPQTEAAPRALVWGDSHAMALLPAYKQLASSHDVRVYFAVKGGCWPLPGVMNRIFPSRSKEACEEFNNAVVDAIERLDPRLVILNAHWADKDENLVFDSGIAPPPGTSNFRFALQQTMKRIGTRRSVCVVLDVPTFKYDVPRSLLAAHLRGISSDFLRLSRQEALQQLAGPERDIGMLQQEHLLTVADPKDVLCRSGWCAYRLNGSALYSDLDHLSVEGALSVVSAIDGCFHGAFHNGLQTARHE